MNRKSWTLIVLASVLPVACGESSNPAAITRPSFAAGGVGRPSVLVNPNSNDEGTAKTIQQGIEMVAPGGKVLIVPGRYEEALVIEKGLTLEAISGGSGPVIVAPPGTPLIAIQVNTSEPVTMRNLTVRFGGSNGIRGDGIVDLTVERATVLAVNPPLGPGAGIGVINLGNVTGGRARLVVRESSVDGGVPTANSATPPFPQMFGIRPAGDVDALIERNVVRHTGAACIHVVTRGDLSGETNADVVGNDLDECYPIGRAGSVLVGTAFGGVPLPGVATATGVVNIVGNTIRNTQGSCLATSGINYEMLSGRIEHNRILGVVVACAFPSARVLPAGIWVGSIRGLPAVNVTVRFNDIEGNAQAGLRLGPNQTSVIEASCNWWGSASGPGAGPPASGDAVVVESGATAPRVTPFATAPIARAGATSC
jgi:hypothetical protein